MSEYKFYEKNITLETQTPTPTPSSTFETLDYWIYEDKLIFKPYFNKPIENYTHLISKYNKLIFSNFCDFHISIKTNNKCVRNFCI